MKDVVIRSNDIYEYRVDPRDPKGEKVRVRVGRAPVILNDGENTMSFDFANEIKIRQTQDGVRFFVGSKDGAETINYGEATVVIKKGEEIEFRFGPKPLALERLVSDLGDKKNYLYVDSRVNNRQLLENDDEPFGFAAVISDPSILNDGSIVYAPETVSKSYAGDGSFYTGGTSFQQSYDMSRYTTETEVKGSYEGTNREAHFNFNGDGSVLIALPRDPAVYNEYGSKAFVPKFYMIENENGGGTSLGIKGQSYYTGLYKDEEGNVKSNIVMGSRDEGGLKSINKDALPGLYTIMKWENGRLVRRTLHMDFKGRARVGDASFVDLSTFSVIKYLSRYERDDPSCKFPGMVCPGEVSEE